MKKRRTIWLDDADRAALLTISGRYTVASESDAIRLAVRLLDESKRVDSQEGKKRQS